MCSSIDELGQMFFPSLEALLILRKAELGCSVLSTTIQGSSMWQYQWPTKWELIVLELTIELLSYQPFP